MVSSGPSLRSAHCRGCLMMKRVRREKERKAKVCSPMIQLPVDWRFFHPDVPLSLSSLLLRIPFLPFSQKAKCAFSFDVCCTFIRLPPLDRVKGPPVGWRSTAIELRRLPMYGIFSFVFSLRRSCVISCFLPWTLGWGNLWFWRWAGPVKIQEAD